MHAPTKIQAEIERLAADALQPLRRGGREIERHDVIIAELLREHLPRRTLRVVAGHPCEDGLLATAYVQRLEIRSAEHTAYAFHGIGGEAAIAHRDLNGRILAEHVR